MTRVFISSDIEGVSGYVDWKQEDTEMERVRRQMTEDINAAIEGALSEDESAEVVVNDSHGSKLNVLIEEIDPSASLIRGGPRELGMVSGVERDIDVGFIIGGHTRPGFGGGLEHVFSSSKISEVSINGTPLGEVELNSLIMREYGVPVSLVTGDDYLKREISDILPETEFVVTKYARGMKAAECRHPTEVRSDIRDAASKAVEGFEKGEVPSIEFEFGEKVGAEVTYKSADIADRASLWPEISKQDSRTVRYVDSDFESVYKFLRASSKV